MSSQHRRFYNSPVSGVAKYISWIPMEIRGRSIVASRYGIRTRIPYTLLQLCTHTPWLVCTAVFPAVSTRGRSGECILLSRLPVARGMRTPVWPCGNDSTPPRRPPPASEASSYPGRSCVALSAYPSCPQRPWLTLANRQRQFPAAADSSCCMRAHARFYNCVLLVIICVQAIGIH